MNPSFVEFLAVNNGIDVDEAQRWLAAYYALSPEVLNALNTWSKHQAEIAADHATKVKGGKGFAYHRGAYDALRHLRSNLSAWCDALAATYNAYLSATKDEDNTKGEEQH